MITAFAPAKVNLALHVTGQRADGYHLLDSLVVFADIGDHLTFQAAERRTMEVTGPFAKGVPTGPENLIWKAVDLVAPEAGFAITLDKTLPHAAGIGGGSSDAAATLKVLTETTEAEPTDPDAVLALGADVPVCVAGRPARMSGIGEQLAPVPPLPPLWLVLVNPGVAVPTGACFQGLASKENAPMTAPDWRDAEGFLAWLSAQRNDLEVPALALEPVIGEALEFLRMAPGCHLARMSGSGATCFGLFAEAEAQAAATSIAAAQPNWWVKAAAILS